MSFDGDWRQCLRLHELRLHCWTSAKDVLTLPSLRPELVRLRLFSWGCRQCTACAPAWPYRSGRLCCVQHAAESLHCFLSVVTASFPVLFGGRPCFLHWRRGTHRSLLPVDLCPPSFLPPSCAPGVHLMMGTPHARAMMARRRRGYGDGGGQLVLDPLPLSGFSPFRVRVACRGSLSAAGLHAAALYRRSAALGELGGARFFRSVNERPRP